MSVPLIGCHDSQKDLKIAANGVKIFTQRTSLEGVVNAYSMCIDFMEKFIDITFDFKLIPPRKRPRRSELNASFLS